jgi:MFS family permease
VYEFWVFLHLVGAFGFFMAHGTSAVTAFKLRRERDRVRVAALLDLSAASLGLLYGSLLLLLAGGVVAGFVGHWWGSAWIWTALGLLVLLMVAMYLLASPYYNRVRNAVGVPTYAQLKKNEDPGPPAPPEELDRLLASPRPFVVAGTGGIGLLAILWLMVFKPF